ncbi:MAG: hypothetical protein H6510_01790 [Acidobacteria bacterium]|nr:hypothetical protein [Acidobacteriota bacterium]
MESNKAYTLAGDLPSYSGHGPFQVNLYGCNGAAMEHTYNGLSLAYQLSEKLHTIVYGFDGSIKFDSNGKPIKSIEQHNFVENMDRNPLGKIGLFVDQTSGDARGYILA